MKRLAALILTVFLILSFACGCASDQPAQESTESTADAQTESEITYADCGEFAIGQPWKVNALWEITVTGAYETEERNDYSGTEPTAVYIISYTVRNIGYTDEYGDGLYVGIDEAPVDSKGSAGYAYPLLKEDPGKSPDFVPLGSTGSFECAVGVDNAGMPLRLSVELCDRGGNCYKATFVIDLSDGNADESSGENNNDNNIGGITL